MQKYFIHLSTSNVIGSIKKLNGGNLAPPISTELAGRNIRKSFAELNMPYTRLHDSPLENAGMRLVDIPLIFANFHADAGDPRNYYFDQTDDYIQTCIELGTGIIYRLGPSIEHSIKKYFTILPEDVDKWIDICSNVIRHYTEGWADGFFFDIKYWEIWNEPDLFGQKMWSGTQEEFNEFYVEAATELKKRFPHLMIGGPAHSSYSEIGKAFIDHCAIRKAPLDFYSYHCYSKDPYGDIVENTEKLRAYLDNAGYKNTELHLNEWHYFSADWIRLRSDSEYKKQVFKNIKGLDSAAFLCTVLSRWQDTPLDAACYYTATTTNWGLYSYSDNSPTKSYYGMKAFGEIIRYRKRVEVSSSDQKVSVLAGQNDSGDTALLVSNFQTGPFCLMLEADIPTIPCKVFLVDDEHNLEEVCVQYENDKMTLNLNSSSSVILIKLVVPGTCHKPASTK